MRVSRQDVFTTAVVLAGVITLAATPYASQADAPPLAGPSTSNRTPPTVASLPVSFEANRGQAGPGTKFIARARGYTLFLASDEAVVSLRQPTRQTSEPHAVESIRMRLVGSDRAVQLKGLDELPGKSNYFRGNDPTKWHTNVATYARVKYQSVYRGIDLVYYGNQQQIEYDFVVAPGADPRAIEMALTTEPSKPQRSSSRPGSLRVDERGALVISTSSGELRLLKPVLYQTSSLGDRQLIDGRFNVRAADRVGFEVGVYDRSRPLIIDPVLSYSTYLGGGSTDGATGIAVDTLGNSYVSGFSCSGDAGCDATLTKINSTGTAVIYSSVLSGGDRDVASAVALNALGEAYVIGSTCSLDFPITAGAFQVSRAGKCDAFLTKLDASGGALYSTFFGGSEGTNASGETGDGIAVDLVGNAYVAGLTCTDDFPVRRGFQSSRREGCDAFAAKLNPAGQGAEDLLYSTFLGSNGVDLATGIAVDAMNMVYVTGVTTGGDFPTTEGAFQTSNGGFSDAFAGMLDMTQSGSRSLLYSTYLGGRFSEGVHSNPSLAVDSDGNIYVSGTTTSADYPTTPGAFQTSRHPDTQSSDLSILSAFVTKLRPAGTGTGDLVYSTFLGGNSREPRASQGERARGIAVGPNGNLYITGDTCSVDFPVTSDAFQASFAGPVLEAGARNPCDAFVVKLNPAGTGEADLVYASYFGGADRDSAGAIALDFTGNAHVAGETESSDLPTTPDAIQTTLGSNVVPDGFVATIPIGNFSLQPIASITVDVGGSGTSSITVSANGEFNAPVTLSVSGAPGLTASFDPQPVTPLPGTSSSSVMTVTLGLAATPGTLGLNVSATSGLLALSTPVQVTVRASSGGTATVIDALTAAGCIDNSGISGALINKLNDAQDAIDAGQVQSAINTLNALLNHLKAQSDQHISSSCTVNGQTFNPAEVLLANVRAIIAALTTADAPSSKF